MNVPITPLTGAPTTPLPSAGSVGGLSATRSASVSTSVGPMGGTTTRNGKQANNTNVNPMQNFGGWQWK